MAQNRSLEGKLALITGASRGIGAGIASNLASKGCNVILNYTSASSTQRTHDLAAALASTYSIKAIPAQSDISTTQGIQALLDQTRTAFAHPQTNDMKIDILINNAGLAGNAHLTRSTPDQLTADFEKQYRLNVLAPLLLTQAVTPHLPSDKSGRIVNLSSVSASLGFPGQSVYGGTKAALEAMTRTWARELADRATVNAVNPGPVVTDMYEKTDAEFQLQMRPWLLNTPLSQVREGMDGQVVLEDVVNGGPDGKGRGGRAATVEEIAGVVGMLVSNEGGWCTGSVICANGGMRMSP